MPTTSERNTHGLDQENTQSGDGNKSAPSETCLFLASFMAMAAGLIMLKYFELSGPFFVIGFGLIAIGGCVLFCQVCHYINGSEEGNQSNSADNQDGSNHLRQPLNSSEVPSTHTTASPSRTAFSYAFVGRQASNYLSSSSSNSSGSSYHSDQSLSDPSLVIITVPPGPPSSRSRTPVGRWQPPRPTSRRSHTSVADDPPPYGSVVSNRPWEDPPSYQEASSCLVPREEGISFSTPNIYNARDNHLSVFLGRHYLASNRFGSESQSSLP